MPLTFTAIVDGLVAQGVRRDRATAIAQRELKLGTVDHISVVRGADEQAVQTNVTRLFRAHGFHVYSLSQARASKQTPGLPDLWVAHQSRPVAFWFETKRSEGGRYSLAQLEFRDECERCGVGYATGDYAAAEQHLVALGFAP